MEVSQISSRLVFSKEDGEYLYKRLVVRKRPVIAMTTQVRINCVFVSPRLLDLGTEGSFQIFRCMDCPEQPA